MRLSDGKHERAWATTERTATYSHDQPQPGFADSVSARSVGFTCDILRLNYIFYDQSLYQTPLLQLTDSRPLGLNGTFLKRTSSSANFRLAGLL